MNDVKVTLKNFRLFEDQNPASIVIGRGFTGFVGPNNSGKSSFLRLFYEMRQVLASLRNPEIYRSPMGLNMLGVHDQEELACDRNRRDVSVTVQLSNVEGVSQVATALQLEAHRGAMNAWKATTLPLIVKDPSEIHEALLKSMEALVNSLYIGPFRNMINSQPQSGYYDLAVGTAFIATWRDWKTGPSKWQNTKIEEVTEDIKQLFRFDKLEINASNDAKTLQVNVDNRPYKLSEHGSGLSQFINVLANAAIKNPDFILIDEPELHLHPSLQVDFLTRLGSYAKVGVIFSTHSIGLARSVADRLYSFRRNASGAEVRSFEATNNYAEFLGELSFSGFREMGCDQILLVEGVHEVRTIRQFLRLFKKDHKIVLLPMGGSQLIRGETEHELGELKRLSSNISALVDSERDSKDGILIRERQDFSDLCAKMGIRVVITERRAIENYFTDAAVKAEKGDTYSSLSEFESLKTKTPAWGKAENWRIAGRMNSSDIEGTDVGKFLSGL